MSFQIITDIADLQKNWLNEHPEVVVAPAMVLVESTRRVTETYYDGVEEPEKFLEVDRLVQSEGRSVTSSQPAIYGFGLFPASVEELTTSAISEGKDVLYLAVNSTISGAYNTVEPLFRQIAANNPERKLICLDSECASTGLNMLIRDLVAQGFENIDEAVAFVKRQRSRIAHLFSWDDLDYISRSGKVPAVAAVIGKMLKIKPLGSCEYEPVQEEPSNFTLADVSSADLEQFGLSYIDLNRPGRNKGTRKLTLVGARIRGRKKFNQLVAQFVAATIDDPTGVITISHGNIPEWAESLAVAIQRLLPNAQVLYGEDWRVGMVIQAHGGPGSIHINYHRKETGNTLKESQELYRQLV